MNEKGVGHMEGLTLESPVVQTIGSQVYQILRSNIINLNLKPGEELNIKELTERLGVSRSPVRDAIMKLAEEGLADIMPQKGTRVSKIDLKRMEEERFLRECLEERVISIFAEQCCAESVAVLEEKIREQEKCLAQQQFGRFLELDEQFHGVIFKATDKEFCWELLQSKCGHYRRVRLMTLWDSGIVSGAIHQHRLMLDCMKNRQTQELIALLHEHCRKINVEEIELFQKYPEYFKEQEIKQFL